MKHNFEEHKQNRIDNARKQAAKNSRLSDDYYVRAKQMASAIPFGQPILVGHHSEKRDRSYRNKIHNAYGKAFETMDKASYYEEKAESIASNNAIFSDDPEALTKLKNELKALEQAQQFMKDANKLLKKNDREEFLKLPYATEKMWDELTNPAPHIRNIGFASYKFSNNGANIRRIKQRIEQLERLQQRPAQEVLFEGGSIIENKEANRIQILFDAKPDEAIRKMLKGAGFRWSPTENAWQRHLNANGIYAAKSVLKQLSTIQNAK
ncbi:DUF3560 domain-containing protein [Pedobacter sp. MC2016-24]|uniref:DUF3560 domain-containing protein n=1 Tax=Pedobacter sp. MC2016-24 TaxID=2780090 RepID=UPI001880A5DC|nr:DUF3560 domain-containing protein [Pedobacter sp. MC2016-24]MBE9598692.1 DUF3560 domain-containing protein [Pedobacter sp. MC2016-24]